MKSFKAYLNEGLNLNGEFGTDGKNKEFSRYAGVQGMETFETWWVVYSKKLSRKVRYTFTADLYRPSVEHEGAEGVPDYYSVEFDGDYFRDKPEGELAISVFSSAVSALYGFIKMKKPEIIMAEPASRSHKKLYSSITRNPTFRRAIKKLGYSARVGADPFGLTHLDMLMIIKDQ